MDNSLALAARLVIERATARPSPLWEAGLGRQPSMSPGFSEEICRGVLEARIAAEIGGCHLEGLYVLDSRLRGLQVLWGLATLFADRGLQECA